MAQNAIELKGLMVIEYMVNTIDHPINSKQDIGIVSTHKTKIAQVLSGTCTPEQTMTYRNLAGVHLEHHGLLHLDDDGALIVRVGGTYSMHDASHVRVTMQIDPDDQATKTYHSALTYCSTITIIGIEQFKKHKRALMW